MGLSKTSKLPFQDLFQVKYLISIRDERPMTLAHSLLRVNTEIVEGVTGEMKQLSSFYLGVTNEWLEAMQMTNVNKV